MIFFRTALSLPLLSALFLALGCGSPSPAPNPGGSAGGATKTFVSSKEGLTGKLAEHYADFSFEYPAGWKLIPADGDNFVKVERAIAGATPEEGNFTQERFAVGTFWSDAPADKAAELLPLVAEQLSGQFAGGFPNYKQVASEATTVAGLKGHEFRFTSSVPGTPKGDLSIWGRCVIVPDPTGKRDGVTLIMLATNLAPGVTSDKDIGVEGEMPVILKTFKLGK